MTWAFFNVLISSDSEVEDLKCNGRRGATEIILDLSEFTEVYLDS